MAIADTVARRLLQDGGGRGVVAFSFGLDGLWQLIAGFFADILAHIVAALAGLAHLLVLPFEALWHLLVAVVSGAAGAVTSALSGLWHLVTGFFPNLFAALAGAAHQLLVVPIEAFCHWLGAAVTGAAGAISSGLGSLWHAVADFFPNLFAALAGAAHQVLVVPIEALWHGLVAAVSGAAGAISSGVGGLWHLVASFFLNILAALAGAAHDLVVLPIETVWHWVQTAADVAVHLVVGAVAFLLVVALACCFGPAICAATVGVCRALALASCYLAHGLFFAGAATLRVCRSLVHSACRLARDLYFATCAATVRACRALACCLAHGLYFAGAAATRGQQQQDEEEQSFLGTEEAEVDIRTKGVDERASAANDTKEQCGGDGEDECVVCLAELRDGKTLRLLLPCDHEFHRACIDSWLRDRAHCPLCRAPVQVDATGAMSTVTAAGSWT